MKNQFKFILFSFCFFANYSMFSQYSLRDWVVVKGYGSNTDTVYGIKGVPSDNNLPGKRSGAATCTDKDGVLWMFGGDNSTFTDNNMNDLWRFDISNYQWTWESGSDQVNLEGNYGQIGIPSPENMIGARQGASMWADDEDNLWIYGGYGGYSKLNGQIINLYDLWKYNKKQKIWTCVKGYFNYVSQGTKAVYGTLGVPDPANSPGGRVGALNFKDKSGNLWLFSGNRGGNDLWKYEIKSGNWTWMKGSNTPNTYGQYGSLKIENASNLPDGRYGSTGFMDKEGNFWIFGGEHFNNDDDTFLLNDLWKFNLATNNWTWMGGKNTFNDQGNFGTKNVFSAENLPPSRHGAMSWVDNDNKFWLFGGSTIQASLYNDTWVFDPEKDGWIWVRGSNLLNQYGTCHTTPDNNQTPGGRTSASVWEDNLGTLWLYGGIGQTCSGVANDQITQSELSKIWIPNVDLKLEIEDKNLLFPEQNKQLNTITITEKSKYGATRIKVQNVIPKGLTFQSRKKDVDSTGILTISNDTLFWNIPFLEPQKMIKLQYYTTNDILNKPNQVENCASIIYQYAYVTNPGDDKACNNITIITSDESFEINAFKIYPNPTNESIQIESIDNISYQWNIVDVLGRVIMHNYKSAIVSQKNQIDIKNIPIGLYYISISTKNKVYFYKFFKN